MSLFVFFISPLIVVQHVSGNHVPIISSWRLCDVIASCWYVPWLQEGSQVRLVGSASMDGFVSQLCRCIYGVHNVLGIVFGRVMPVALYIQLGEGFFRVETQLIYDVLLLYWRHDSALKMGHLQVTRHVFEDTI